MKFYVGDYLADTRRLTTLEHGAYILLICEYWRNGGLPADETRLARIAGLDAEQWQCVRIAMAELFQSDWTHKRIDEELAEASEKSAKAAQSASKRWEHKIKPKMRTHSERNANQISEPEPEKKELSLVSLAPTPAEPDVAIRPPSDADRKAKSAEKVELIQNVVGRWNKLASDWRLPPVKDITEPRQRAILARSKDLTETYDFTEPMAGFEALLSKVRASPFLRGEKGFRVDFDFVVKQASFTKIMEGKYEADLKRFS